MTTPDRAVRRRLWLAHHGFRLFPLIPGTKRPAVRDWENRATTDPAALKHWPDGGGAGIACGPSNIVALDLDAHGGDAPRQWAGPGITDGHDVFASVWAEHAPEGTSFWDTMTVITPSGGTHLYYRAPDRQVRNSAGRIGWQVDVRAHGGYVVAPGTVTDAGEYTMLYAPERLLTLPDWLTSLLVDHKPAERRAGEFSRPRKAALPSRSGARVEALARTVAEAGEGQRNCTLNWAAWQLAQDNILTREHADLLLAAAEAAGITRAESIATIRSASRRVGA